MRGRKPKPTHIKLVAGNPGKRPLRKDEPKPKAAMPECPPHLGPEAVREWRRMSKELSDIGLLTRIDRAMFAGYCQAWGRWVEAELAMAEKGPVVKAKKTGVAMISPFLSVANKAMEQMRQFAEQLGMSPSSRSRVSSMPPPTPASDWDELDPPA